MFLLRLALFYYQYLAIFVVFFFFYVVRAVQAADIVYTRIAYDIYLLKCLKLKRTKTCLWLVECTSDTSYL